MSDAQMAAQIALLFDALKRMQLITYFDLAACTMFLWDYVVTIGMEVELVWSSPWTAMKVVYFVQRYMPFFDTLWLTVHLQLGHDLSITQCRRMLSTICYMYCLGIAASELILTLRAWAVWKRDKRLAVILVVTYLLVWVPNLAYMTLFLRSLKFGDPPVPGFVGCFMIDGSRIVILCWIVVIVWDAFVLILMAIPGFKAYRVGGNKALLDTIYRDGLIFYIYLFVLSTVNIIVIQTLPAGYIILLSSTERCLHSILSSRVLLHIRAHGREREEATQVQWSNGIAAHQGIQSNKAAVSHVLYGGSMGTTTLGPLGKKSYTHTYA
ncbi:hypothetical protein B0H34DRAFT_680288 [Crassisporium funariophilum]|nr:hypothetical protein B0H34DRAFT_680288 [Crassisporium funariophilum]